MEKIKYHPLIDCDTSGTEKVPMFFHTDRDTVAAELQLLHKKGVYPQDLYSGV